MRHDNPVARRGIRCGIRAIKLPGAGTRLAELVGKRAVGVKELNAIVEVIGHGNPVAGRGIRHGHGPLELAGARAAGSELVGKRAVKVE